MANFLTQLNLLNQALILLGDQRVTTLTTNTAKVNAWNEHYAVTLDDLLESHFWNWATVRTTIFAYAKPAATLTPAATTGTGILFTTSVTGIFGLDAVGKRLLGSPVPGDATIVGLVTSSPPAALTPGATAITPGATGVIFTAGAPALAGADVGKLIENLAGAGVARVTGFTDASHVTATILTAWETVTPMASGAWRFVRTDQVTADIGQAFASTAAIPAGSWRLYNEAPNWGFSWRLTLPTDLVRIQRVRHASIYQIEGSYLIAGQESLNITYTRRVSDITQWPAHFVNALVYSMVAKIAEPATGQRTKQQDWVALASAKFQRARLIDGMQGSPPMLRASDLAQARRGAGPVYTTEE
jgi:hypothetical protein